MFVVQLVSVHDSPGSAAGTGVAGTGAVGAAGTGATGAAGTGATGAAGTGAVGTALPQHDCPEGIAYSLEPPSLVRPSSLHVAFTGFVIVPGQLGSPATGVAGTGVAGTGVAGTGTGTGTGVAGTGVAGTGVAGTGVAGTGVAGTGVAGTGVGRAPPQHDCPEGTAYASDPPSLVSPSSLQVAFTGFVIVPGQLGNAVGTGVAGTGVAGTGVTGTGVGVVGTGVQALGIPSNETICEDVNPTVSVVPEILLRPEPVGAVPYAPE